MRAVHIDSVGELGLRPKTDGDTPFVMATWIRSFSVYLNGRERKAVCRKYRIDADAFFSHFPTVVLCSTSDADTIHGWACGSGDFLAWAYIPVDLRGYGIGKLVITEALGGYPGTVWVGNPRQRAVSPRFLFDEARYGEALEKATRK
jgi:hypothetical protein